MLTGKQRQMLDYMDKDIFRKNDKISKQVLDNVEEMESRNFSKEELETMKKNYELVCKESNGSGESILGVGELLILYISAIVGFDLFKEALGLGHILLIVYFLLFIVLVLPMSIWVMYILGQRGKISKDTVRIRNRILAINMLLLEFEEEEKKKTRRNNEHDMPCSMCDIPRRKRKRIRNRIFSGLLQKQ